MTLDLAIWKQDGRLSDRQATTEFERRADASDGRYPDYRTPLPELTRLADLLEAEFPDEDETPWEDLRGSLDGDFLYLTMGSDHYQEVEDFLVVEAPKLGLLVYSPIGEGVVAQP